jgi:hypothetical protein
MSKKMYLEIKKRIVDKYKRDCKALRSLFYYVDQIEVRRENKEN